MNKKKNYSANDNEDMFADEKHDSDTTSDDSSHQGSFDLNACYDCKGNFDSERLEDAILDGEYVPEDW